MELDSILDRVFAPVDETGDEQRLHVWVGIIALVLIAYVGGLKLAFGKRAI